MHKTLKIRQEELIVELDQMTQQKLKNAAAQQDQLELVYSHEKLLWICAGKSGIW